MLNKIMLSVVILELCSHGCLAQIAKPSSAIVSSHTAPLNTRLRLLPANKRQMPLILFPQLTVPPQSWDPMDMDWGCAELAAHLASIHPGMSFKIAVQRLRLLGGVEDGGMQCVPATRYFFKPGYIVTIPQKEGRVSGPVRVALGQMALD